MELWIASGNKGKINEFKMLLNDMPLEFHSQNELKSFSQPPENGNSFLENATIKAKSLKAVKNSNCWVVAEDSGIEVEGLGGLPGIHSARYAGPHASDQENVAKLLKMVSIRCSDNRKARFYCSLISINPSGELKEYIGILNGSISLKAQGQAGFGYDVCFIPEGESKTLAELGLAFKNKVSHRSIAIAAFKNELKNSL